VAPRVTLDTNIYVSAFQFGGMRLLHMAVDGDIEIAVSPAIIDEVIRVLRDKFLWDGYRLHDARQQILGFARLVTPAHTLDVVKED
jgi:predicted nucleic acid-binding protein